MTTGQLVRVLRATRIGVKIVRGALPFGHIQKWIGLGFPIIVGVERPGVDDHWAVLYGYQTKFIRGERRRFVYLAGNNWLGLHPHYDRVCAYEKFRKLRIGEALVCWGR